MTPPFTIHIRLFSLSRSRSRSLFPSLFLCLSLPLPLSFSLSLSLSSRLYSEYTTYTLPKLRTLSTLSSIFISVKYWLDFGVERWGKGEVQGQNERRSCDGRKKKKRKKTFFSTIFRFFRRSFFISFSLLFSPFHDFSSPPLCRTAIGVRSNLSAFSRINFSTISKI